MQSRICGLCSLKPDNVIYTMKELKHTRDQKLVVYGPVKPKGVFSLACWYFSTELIAYTWRRFTINKQISGFFWKLRRYDQSLFFSGYHWVKSIFSKHPGGFHLSMLSAWTPLTVFECDFCTPWPKKTAIVLKVHEAKYNWESKTYMYTQLIFNKGKRNMKENSFSNK